MRVMNCLILNLTQETQIIVYRGKLSNRDRTGPMVVTATDQVGRVLSTTTKVIGGGLSHIDLSVDQSTEGPVSIDIYDKNGIHVVSCKDWQMVSTEVYSNPPFYRDTFKIIALCAFTPDSRLTSKHQNRKNKEGSFSFQVGNPVLLKSSFPVIR